jgi:hypothetical protein
MPGHRIRVDRLENAGQIAHENAKVYKMLRRGQITATLARTLSQILLNQRVIIESFEAQKRIEQLEELLTNKPKLQLPKAA